mgnify:CR=1 FL=1
MPSIRRLVGALTSGIGARPLVKLHHQAAASPDSAAVRTQAVDARVLEHERTRAQPPLDHPRGHPGAKEPSPHDDAPPRVSEIANPPRGVAVLVTHTVGKAATLPGLSPLMRCSAYATSTNVRKIA